MFKVIASPRGVALAGLLLALSSSLSAASYTVDNTGDSGIGTLRQAILDANANPGPDVIDFNIAGSGPFTIQPVTQLPTITDPVVIDGTTQPGYASSPRIWLFGVAKAFEGLRINASDCSVRGLAVTGFSNGIHVLAVNNCTFAGNYLGLTPASVGVIANQQSNGLFLEGSTNCYIGPLSGVGANVVSNNTAGIRLGTGSGHTIQGNIIGIGADGKTPVAGITQLAGIALNSTMNCQIGGNTPALGNVISRNDQGVSSSGTNNNIRIQGNLIGLALGGTKLNSAAIHGFHGMLLGGLTGGSIVGGPNPGEGNRFCNTTNALSLNGNNGLTIQNNDFGFLADGGAYGNQHGIFSLSGSDVNDVIVGNYFAFQLFNALVAQDNGASVQGNVIGYTRNGIFGPQTNGIFVATNCKVGTISPNFVYGCSGIAINAAGSNTQVMSNYIGTNAAGTLNHPNGIGIRVDTFTNNMQIGAVGQGNTIAYCNVAGIVIETGTNSKVIGNYIGTDASGTMSFPNRGAGIRVLNDTTRWVIQQNKIANTIPSASLPGLGIEVDGNGVNANDPLDADIGPNGIQNFPVLIKVMTEPGGTRVIGTLHSAASRSFTMEFFKNASLDPTGFGEGHTALGFVTASTNASGDLSFNALLPGTTVIGDKITATATLNLAASSATSEFSAGVSVQGANNAPVADAGTDQFVSVPHDGNPATNNANFTLDGTGSADPDSDAITYLWKEGSTTIGTSSTVPLIRAPGMYTFTLTVTDVVGATSTDTVVVTINAEPNDNPAANPGDDQSVAVEHDGDPGTDTVSVTLTGVASDPDSDAVTYEWKDGNGNVVGTNLTLTVTLTAGDYTYTFTVKDSYGATDSDTVDVHVDPEPNATPGLSTQDTIVTVPHDGNPNTNTADVELPGSGFDPDGDDLTYEWKDPDGNVIATTPTTTVTLPVSTSYYTFRVTDSYGATMAVVILVQVNPEENTPPFVDMPTDRTLSITHDGSAATNTASDTLTAEVTNPDGDPLTYEWKDQNGNVLGTALTVTVNLQAGTHVLTFTATDPYGATGSGTVMIAVNPEPNAGPTANAGNDGTVLTAPGDTTATFTLNGAGSSDPESDTLTHSWSDGVSVIGTTATISVTRPVGVHTFTLTVTDPYGLSHSDTVTITVVLGNQAPNANAGANQTVTVPHDGNPSTNTASVTLDGSGSNDPDNQAITYEWRDGSNAVVGTSAQIALNLEAGIHMFSLAVTDTFGASSTSSVSVTVNPEPNDGPSVNGGPDMLGAADANGQASFTITATASDPDNDALTIKWYEGATQIGTGATLSTTLNAGTHTLTVVATDPYGIAASDTVVVSVQYTGTFFLQPINNDNSSIFKQGSTVPVKFQLTGASAGATNVVARIYIAKVTNNVIGTEMEPVSTSAADTGNLFRYSGGIYIFNLNTKNLTPGTYQIRADLGDGALHTVLISLKP